MMLKLPPSLPCHLILIRELGLLLTLNCNWELVCFRQTIDIHNNCISKDHFLLWILSRTLPTCLVERRVLRCHLLQRSIRLVPMNFDLRDNAWFVTTHNRNIPKPVQRPLWTIISISLDDNKTVYFLFVSMPWFNLVLDLLNIAFSVTAAIIAGPIWNFNIHR